MSGAHPGPFQADDDRVLPFQIANSPVRGRVVRLGGAIDAILAAHPFEPPVLELVGEAATLVTLMGSALKFDGKLILQAQGDGPVSMVVADYAASGALRAPIDRARGDFVRVALARPEKFADTFMYKASANCCEDAGRMQSVALRRFFPLANS